MEQIIAFITPGPMSENVKFSTRVLTSWFSLGIVLGLFLGLVGLSSGTSDPAGAFFSSLIAGPIIICSFGLLGLAINSSRGIYNEYAGWYWYVFPVVTYILLGFVLTMAMLGFILGMAGISLPSSPQGRSTVNPEEFQKNVGNMKLEEVLKEFKQQLDELNKLDKQGNLTTEQQKVIRKVLSFDRGKYDARFRDVLGKDELRIFIILLLRLLGVEVR